MQSSTTVTFARTASITGAAGIELRLVDSDNVDSLTAYKEAYQAEHGAYPSFSTKEERSVYADLLLAVLRESFTRVVRVYNYDASTLVLTSVRSLGVKRLTTKTEEVTESITLVGGTTVNTEFPVEAVLGVTYNLRDSAGKVAYPSYSIDDNGAVSFQEEMFGFVTIHYRHSYLRVEIETTTKTAVDKLSSILMAIDKTGTVAMEIDYPDAEDENGISADEDDDGWRLTVRTVKPNMHPDWWEDPENEAVLNGEVFTEVARTVSPVTIDGIQIDRAETVRFMSEKNSDLKLIFTSLNTEQQGG